MSRAASSTRRPARTGSLMVRLDPESKEYLARAAQLRRISVSDYVRVVTVSQATREVRAAGERTICLTPEEQLAFWQALSEAPELTTAQRRLAKVMKGDSCTASDFQTGFGATASRRAGPSPSSRSSSKRSSRRGAR